MIRVAIIAANLCGRYLAAARNKEDLQRRMRVVNLEQKLLAYAYGTALYWAVREEMKKS